MSERPQIIATSRRKQRKRGNWAIAVGVLAVLAAGLLVGAWDARTTNDVAPAANENPPTASDTKTAAPSPTPESNIIDDDGKSLWVSPTNGPPLDLAYLPPGVEVILAVRSATILATTEGEKIVDALGPRGASAIAALESALGVPLREIERLTVGWQVGRGGGLTPTIVAATKSPILAPLHAYQPEQAHGRITVVAPESALADIRTLNGAPPPLARDLERLISHTDNDRSATLVTSRSLLREPNSPLDQEFAPLQRALESTVGADAAAIAVSFDWGDDFFAEVLAVPTLDSSPERLSEQLAAKVKDWPAEVERAVLELTASPYSRRVVARLPEMMRRVAAYTRAGHERDVTILRCYLPRAAGHNLLLAAELTLAEGQGRGGEMEAATPLASAGSQASIEERLQKRTTLRFGREELEAALKMLAEDVGVPIDIRGQDLQLDGITRNQLFAIDLADRPADEILVEILRRANPDKTATGPADPRQELVYVVGPRGIIITTRSQAAARGEELPAAFRAE